MHFLHFKGCLGEDSVQTAQSNNPVVETSIVVEINSKPVTLQQVSAASAVPEGGRIHVCLEGRYVTILRHSGHLHCIDSVCFHAGGPLGIGDIEELGDKACILCPWHYYKIDIVTGEKYYQTLTWVHGKATPGDWKSNGQKQRVHPIREQNGFIYVALDKEGNYESDEYASNVTCGERVIAGGASAARRKAGMVGGDGRRSL